MLALTTSFEGGILCVIELSKQLLVPQARLSKLRLLLFGS